MWRAEGRTLAISKLVSEGAERVKKRKIPQQPRFAILKDVFGPNEVAKTVLSEINQSRVSGQPIGEHVSGGIRQNDLSSVCSGEHPGNAVDCLAKEVSIATLLAQRG